MKDSSDEKSLLIFRVGPYRFCSSIDRVEGIILTPTITTLPMTPKSVLGTFLFRNNIATAISLAIKTGFVPETVQQSNSQAIVTTIDSQIIGFIVDEVEDIEQAHNFSNSDVPYADFKHIAKEFKIKDGNVFFFVDFEALFRLKDPENITPLILKEHLSTNKADQQESATVPVETDKENLSAESTTKETKQAIPIFEKSAPGPTQQDRAFPDEAKSNTTSTPPQPASGEKRKKPSVTMTPKQTFAAKSTKPLQRIPKPIHQQSQTIRKQKIDTPQKTPAPQHYPVPVQTYEEAQHTTSRPSLNKIYIAVPLIVLLVTGLWSLFDTEKPLMDKRTGPVTVADKRKLIDSDASETRSSSQEADTIIKKTDTQPHATDTNEVVSPEPVEIFRVDTAEISITLERHPARSGVGITEEVTKKETAPIPPVIAPVVDAPKTLPPAGKTDMQTEFTHVVAKGDTLWAIAERYIGNPLKYKELASLSQIKDPHWIYPDDIIRIVIRKKNSSDR
ncbi:chemotaxis protein CheW [Thermodesulfobacteriota bacterium]